MSICFSHMSKENIMTIGNRVLTLLNEKGLKQKDLADYLGTKPSTVNGWKEPNRNPSSDLIVRICEFLGTSYEFILTGTEKITHSYSSEDSEWLSLIHQLPKEAKYEFRGELKGYIKRLNEESVAADKPFGKTGTDNPK